MNTETTAHQARIRRRLKMVSAAATVGAFAVMGVVTFAESSPGGIGLKSAPLIAGTESTTPSNAPTVASAVPAVKATSYIGGDWPGMGH